MKLKNFATCLTVGSLLSLNAMSASTGNCGFVTSIATSVKTGSEMCPDGSCVKRNEIRTDASIERSGFEAFLPALTPSELVVIQTAMIANKLVCISGENGTRKLSVQ